MAPDIPVESDRLETAVEAAERAGDLQRARFRTGVAAEYKGRHETLDSTPNAPK